MRTHSAKLRCKPRLRTTEAQWDVESDLSARMNKGQNVFDIHSYYILLYIFVMLSILVLRTRDIFHNKEMTKTEDCHRNKIIRYIATQFFLSNLCLTETTKSCDYAIPKTQSRAVHITCAAYVKIFRIPFGGE